VEAQRGAVVEIIDESETIIHEEEDLMVAAAAFYSA